MMCQCRCRCPSWRAPRHILGMSEARHDRVRRKFHILVEGEGIPPPIKSFKEMKFPAGRPGQEPGRDPTFLLAAALRGVCHWWKSCCWELGGRGEGAVQVMDCCPLLADSYPEGSEEERNPAANAHTDPRHPHNVSFLFPPQSTERLLPRPTRL